MAIGAHELLLIVRAQNQASALLGRVGRDFRRMQNMRDLSMARDRLSNQMASKSIQMQQTMARISSTVNENGRVRLQHEQAIQRSQLHTLNIEDRISNLEIRRSAVARANKNIEVQRLRLMQQELSIESSLAKIELKRQAMFGQIGRMNLSLMRNAQQGDALKVRSLNTQAQILERQVALNKANSAYMKAVRKGGAVSGSNVALARQAAELRLSAAKGTLGLIPGQRDILAEQAAGIKSQIALTEASMKGLDDEQMKLAASTRIIQERYAALEEQLRGVQARDAAITTTEAELNKMLEVEATNLKIINAQYAENVAARERDAAALKGQIEEYRLLNAQLKQTDELMAIQSSEKITTMFRGISHIGRVLQATGLIGVAAFGAMGIAAAHFNTEAVRASTQVGNINQTAATTVKNADRIEKAIIGIMQSIPANQHDLTDALYNIYSSMDSTFGQGTKLLKLFGQVWVAGGMTGNIEDVSNALITLGNNWKVNAGDMKEWQKLAASTLATVRFGRLTVEQYTQTMNQLAPAFHGAHQSIEQMNGAIAFLTKLMPSQRMSAASLARMVEQLQRFAAAPKPGFEDLAKSITDTTGNLKPLDEVISIILQRMPELKTSGLALTNFFKNVSGQQGTVQARRAFQGLIQNFDLYRESLKNTSGDQKEFNRDLKAMERSTGVRWATFVNQMRALGLELGAAVVPMLLKAASGLERITKWFNGLSDAQKKSIGHWAAIAAITTLVAGTIMTIVGGMALFVLSVKTLRTVGLGSAIGASTPQVALLITGLTALAVILAKYPHLIHMVTQAMGGLRGVLKGLSILAGAFTLRAIITSLLGLSSNARLATTRVALLRTRLLGLATIGAITIPIVENITAKLDGKKLGTTSTKYSGGILGYLQKVNDAINYGAARIGGASPAEARAFTQYMNKHGLTIAPAKVRYNNPKDVPKAYVNEFSYIIGSPFVSDKMLQVAQAAFAAQDWRTLGKIYDTAKKLATVKPGGAIANRRNYISTGPQAPQIARDATWNKLFANVIKLDKIVTKAGPKATMAQIRALLDAQDALQKASVGNQYAAAQQFLNNLEQMWSSAEKGAKKHKNTMVSLAKQEARAVMSAQDAMRKKVQDAVSKLEDTYNQLRDANQQMLGEIGQGRVLQGPIGQAYQSLAEYNIAPPIKFLLQDQQSQHEDFVAYRKQLSKLRNEGAPQALIEELQQQGQGGRMIVQSLASGTQKQVDTYIKTWESNKGLIQKATQLDFKQQLKDWEKYGKKSMWAMLTGVKSQSSFMAKGFRKYILTDAFSAQMRDWIKTEFPNIIKEAGRAAAAKFEKKHKAIEAAGAKAAASAKSNAPKSEPSRHLSVVYNNYGADTHMTPAMLRKHKFELQTATGKWF